jgi:hypothetical protein
MRKNKNIGLKKNENREDLGNRGECCRSILKGILKKMDCKSVVDWAGVIRDSAK